MIIDQNSSEYVNECRLNYSMYVLRHRAFQSISDGLAAGSRRLMWTARDGHKRKSAALSGETMCLHPHGDSTETVNTLAKVYGNNIPLLEGFGSFGTRLKPEACGAPRYTSVKASTFAKDVLYRDIEIVPTIPNYDDTLIEPKHFLPLVPLVLVNPSSGIGIGYASDILPRRLSDVIADQIKVLSGKKIKDPGIWFKPFDAVSVEQSVAKNGKPKWHFEGQFELINSTTIKITNIPYGVSHKDLTDKVLSNLIDTGVILDFIDDSNDVIDITVKFKRGQITSFTGPELMEKLGLTNTINENTNVLDFDGERLIVEPSYVDVVTAFCDWRLTWYVKRFERLKSIIIKDIQRYLDVLLAIKKNAGGVAKNTESRATFVEWLNEIGVVDCEYIAGLPVYRFTQAEADAIAEKLAEAKKTLAEYDEYLTSEPKRAQLFIAELKEVAKKYG